MLSDILRCCEAGMVLEFVPVILQVFIIMTGVFVSSWMGGAALSVGEWIIKKLPLIKHIYSAAKQVCVRRPVLLLLEGL